MKIDKNNPLLSETIMFICSIDEYLDNINYQLSIENTETEVFRLKDLHYNRVEDLRKIYDHSYLTSDGFYHLNFKYLPFDLALDLNVKMASYLCDKDTNKKYSLEVAEIKIPTLKWAEAIYSNPDSWQEINRKFGMTPVLL